MAWYSADRTNRQPGAYGATQRYLRDNKPWVAKPEKRGLSMNQTGAQIQARNSYLLGRQGLLRAMQGIDPAFDEARRGLTMQGDVARRDIQTGYTQAQAGADQGFISSGLYNTTAYDAQRRRLRNIKQQSLSSLDQRIAEQAAAIESARGAAKAQGHGGLAATKQAYAGALGNIAAGKSADIASTLYGHNTGDAVGAIGSLVGAGLGLWAGYGGGSGSGGYSGSSGQYGGGVYEPDNTYGNYHPQGGYQ